MFTNAKWLSQVVEEPEDPDMPICDPHHHLWWTRGYGVTPRYMIDDYIEDIVESGHNIISSVFVTCGTMFRQDGPDQFKVLGETEFVNGMAAMSASGEFGARRIAAGIVGTAYLRTGDAVAGVLDAQIAVAGGRFKGIREGAFWDQSPEVPNHRTNPPPGLYLAPDFRKGFAHLAPRGLSFEALCYHPQLPDVIDLARAFPGTSIILNHLGCPIGVGPYAGRKDDVFSDWKRSMTVLARCQNVTVKLGGIQMGFNGFGWHGSETPPSSDALLERTRHFHETAIELFGTGRCMFESNFPVDKMSCSYGVLWNSFKKLAATFSAGEKRALFYENAVKTYRLPNFMGDTK